jgi:hypothetical protein
MVVVSGEIGGQSLDVRGDFQKAIRKPVSLRFGNGCITATARNPFGSLAFVRQFGRCGERFHGLKLTHGQTRSNRFDRAREFSVVIH